MHSEYQVRELMVKVPVARRETLSKERPGSVGDWASHTERKIPGNWRPLDDEGLSFLVPSVAAVGLICSVDVSWSLPRVHSSLSTFSLWSLPTAHWVQIT